MFFRRPSLIYPVGRMDRSAVSTVPRVVIIIFRRRIIMKKIDIKKKMPVIFAGHGSPMNAVGDNRARRGWREIGEALGKPQVIIAVSSHWATQGLFVRKSALNPQINDMIFSVDGLTGFGDAISAVYPQAEIQRCIVHQIRYTTKFVASKDIKAFMADLKNIYQAPNEEAAGIALDELDEKWGSKYPSSVSSWRSNWAQLSTYFKYPPEIRKIIYTTNSIENFNRQLRKVTKTRTIFPTDDSLFKILYLAMMDITKKWKGRPRDWGQILSQLMIYFGDRISDEDLE